jgi:hypothetical protein
MQEFNYKGKFSDRSVNRQVDGWQYFCIYLRRLVHAMRSNGPLPQVHMPTGRISTVNSRFPKISVT